MRNSLLFSIMLLACALHTNAQSVEVSGKIIASNEVEGIHIINKTASRFTISSSNGDFTIPAKLNDTILFSGISYQPKEIVVTKVILASQQLTVYLEEAVNILDEVVVGKVLTGNLMFDIHNAELKPDLNFYNLGIPGYTGKLKTQTERRLYEATSGGGLIPVGLIINAISGRTKRLKHYVKLEKKDTCLDKIIAEFSADLFRTDGLEPDIKAQFFYYCQDDPEFENLCKLKSSMKTLMFLEAKLKAFQALLQTQKEEN
ncbi:carboxypeptidase-like regulatory domain-containing protein [Gelidibacter salicanalis]|uniref:Carboxypeptidase-like regulatory domain-containing protein n=1 Tax=Gelidibacter salicanalis TaxID=291193 RepID=A0A934KPI9_9FLAO|nr:carboxypeptidase-like regulatory domain-containing protein [Gelidibacter salicanalis]MBJ7879101.1 carboxypeptidase-like regulatory domain-containing protein [Gelidibacter salicanalis]